MNLKKVVIVGKTNVGKSQLFNRLIRNKHSVVLNRNGVTRDRVSLMVEWLKYKFFIIDCGGYSETDNEVNFQKEINQQTKEGLDEANLIIFVISKKDLINDEDMKIAKMIKKYNKKTLLVINKCELNVKNSWNDYSEIKLGFGEGLNISAEHGINIGVLLDTIVNMLNLSENEFLISEKKIKFSFIGKTNVGKSSLCNTLLQSERLIVSPISGTTRDVIQLDFSYNKRTYTLLDTPGIKKNKFLNQDKLDFFSILRTKKSLKQANIICFVIDLVDGISEFEERIGGLIYKANIPTIIIGNKWDLIDYKSDIEKRKLILSIRKKIPYLNWAPIIFLSAKFNDKITNIFSTLDIITEEINRTFSDVELKNFLNKIISLGSPAKVENNTISLYKITQIKSQIQAFMITCNNVKYLHFSYSRMIENKLRESFGLKNCPIKIFFRSKNKKNK